jgi:hypothetical protein
VFSALGLPACVVQAVGDPLLGATHLAPRVQSAAWPGQGLDIRSDAIELHLTADIARIPCELGSERTVV